MRKLVSILIAILVFHFGEARAEAVTPTLVEKHRGIVFAAINPPADYNADIPLLSLIEGINRLKIALDRLESGAPELREAINRLRHAGQVVIVYHPVSPARQTAAITAAAFYPQFFNPAKSDDTFLVVFGRYGVKWPIDDIALVLAHELAGHGIQHLEKRLPAPDTIDTNPRARRADFECEANLYTEWALQQLDLDPQSGPHAGHRRALEQRWCKPFIEWLSRIEPTLAGQWKNRHPDVAKLLPALHRFIAMVAEDGIHSSYQSATLEQARNAAAALQANSPSSLYLRGRNALHDGDIETAIALLERAAERRFNRANILLAEIMLSHAPGGPYTVQARAYLEAAQTRGSLQAAAKLKALDGLE